MRDDVRNEYFEWLSRIVCGDKFSKDISYKKLLMRLHDTPFRYVILRDRNRAEDGISLRYRFVLEQGYEEMYDDVMIFLEGPCSVFEMMVALAIRCEENIMDDPNVGDRTSQWFWGMITNLGLGAMHNKNFDRQYVDERVAIFLDREYRPDGKGGLFTIRHCDRDLRDVEIWYQLCWYLDRIV